MGRTPVVAALLALLLGGCAGEDPLPYCSTFSGIRCPAGMRCDEPTRTCIPEEWDFRVRGAVPDGGAPDRAALPPDGGNSGDFCAPLGSSCGGDSGVLCCGVCVGGVCCESACSGDPGCAGTCDSSGRCTYPAAGTQCKATCAGAGPSAMETRYTCDQNHRCVAGTPRLCAPYICKGDGSGCYTGCGRNRFSNPASRHMECNDKSVCDVSQAHTTAAAGLGNCVDPNKEKVVVVKPPASASDTPISDAVKANITGASDAVTLRIKVGTYTETVAVTQGKLKLIADGAVTISTDKRSAPVIGLAGDGSVSVQGITVSGSPTVLTAGIAVEADSTVAELEVLESILNKHALYGAIMEQTRAVFRRNTISENAAGGLYLIDSSMTFVNNLVMSNGDQGKLPSVMIQQRSSSSSIPDGGKIIFANNTVADNTTNTGKVVGVGCDPAGAATLHNSIFWSNSLSAGTMQVYGCTIKNSTVQGATAATGINTNDPKLDSNYVPQASEVVDAGDGTVVDTAIDFAGKTRVQGSGVDHGAFEVK